MANMAPNFIKQDTLSKNPNDNIIIPFSDVEMENDKTGLLLFLMLSKNTIVFQIKFVFF